MIHPVNTSADRSESEIPFILDKPLPVNTTDGRVGLVVDLFEGPSLEQQKCLDLHIIFLIKNVSNVNLDCSRIAQDRIVPHTEVPSVFVDKKLNLWGGYQRLLELCGYKEKITIDCFLDKEITGIDKKGTSLLNVFLSHSNHNLVVDLIAHRNFQFLNVSDNKGRTPLYIACKVPSYQYDWDHSESIEHLPKSSDPMQDKKFLSEFSKAKCTTIRFLLDRGAIISPWATKNPIKALCSKDPTLPSMILIARELDHSYWRLPLDQEAPKDKQVLKDKFVKWVSGNLLTDKELTIYMCFRTFLKKEDSKLILKHYMSLNNEDLDKHFESKKLHEKVLSNRQI